MAAQAGPASTCAELLARHPGAWASAVTHPFLQECKAGTIGENQFDAWLVQDYFFARAFTRFHAHALAKAPYESFDLLLAGLGAMKDELLWFQDLIKQRGLHLDCPAHPVTQRYLTFMEGASKQPYAAHAVAFWAIERAYNGAWGSHMEGMAQPYRTYAERWGSAGFGEYCRGLERQADAALQAASEQERRQAEALFLEVCDLEREFWQMAYTATTFE
ncbi:hypothetical protein ABPG75_004415 [Micractinium tetrahymenae]